MAHYATYIAFDVETTGLDYKKEQIIEIAGAKFTVKIDGKKVTSVHIDAFESFVKPTMFIPKEATNINHITNEMVEDAPSIAEVMVDFKKFCGLSSILIAHNADFDAKFIYKAMNDNNIPLIKNPIYDSLRLARKIMPEAPSYKLGELAKRLRRQMNIELNSENLHRALYDCEILREVFVAILSKRLMPRDWDLSEFLKVMENVHGGIVAPKI